MSPKLLTSLPCLIVIALAGCAGGGIGSITGAALESVGIRKPAAVPDAQQPARSIAIKLHAGSKLNVDAHGQPLALIARIYKLRQRAAFEQAPYDTFLSPQKEKEAFGADLLEAKEVVLVPGQRYEVSEKVSREAAFVGIVALFHSPAPQHWRLAFAAADLEKTGMTIGVNACALSVGMGAATLTESANTRSPVQCQ
jgi:type VI secretion system protein VasD